MRMAVFEMVNGGRIVAHPERVILQTDYTVEIGLIITVLGDSPCQIVQEELEGSYEEALAELNAALIESPILDVCKKELRRSCKEALAVIASNNDTIENVASRVLANAITEIADAKEAATKEITALHAIIKTKEVAEIHDVEVEDAEGGTS